MGLCQSCLGGNDSASSTLDRPRTPDRVNRVRPSITQVYAPSPTPYNRSVTQTSQVALRQAEQRIANERLNHFLKQTEPQTCNVQPIRNNNRPTFTLENDVSTRTRILPQAYNVQPISNYSKPTFTLGSDASTRTTTVIPPTCNIQPIINANRPIFTIGSGTSTRVRRM